MTVLLTSGLLAFLCLDGKGPTIFSWLLSVAGLGTLFSWGSICLARIQFRSVWKYHGHSLDEIPFQALFGVYGSWAGLIFVVLVLVAQSSLL